MQLKDLYQSFPSLPKPLRLQFVQQYRSARALAFEELQNQPIKKARTKSQARVKSTPQQKLSETEKALLKKLGVSLKALKNIEE